MSRRLFIAVLALWLLPLAACGTTGDGRPTVVASFYPLQFLTQQIAGTRVRVVNLTEPGAEPHDLDPSIKQVAEIADATLVVYSAGLQPAVDGAVQQNAKAGLDVSGVVDLQGGNPHFWLDPLRLAKAADALEKKLAELLPTYAAEFSANLAKLTTTLDGLDAAYSAGLKNCARDVVVSTHDAFGYQARYGLKFAPIAGLSPDAEPSPAHLRQLHDLITSDHLTTVFNETIASPKLARTLASDLGLRTAVLDPIEGLRKGSTEDYVSIMKANLAALQQADDCRPGAKVSP